MQDFSSHLPFLIDLSIKAGREILGIYATDFDIRSKDDRSPVTEADELAEAIILTGLDSLGLSIPVVAEEQAAAGNIPDVSGGLFWLVDPLDGTKEFINKRGEFTVNIGLICDGAPILGVVYAPAKGQLFYGSTTQAAKLRQVGGEQDGLEREIRVRKARQNNLSIIASKSHLNPETEQYLTHYSGADIVSAGSSLKFCLVACGEADLYPRLGPTMEWDTAAGHAVLRAAGGEVLHPDGSPFSYAKPEFRNGFFVARGDSDLVHIPF